MTDYNSSDHRPDAKSIRRYILNIQEAEADVSGFLEKKQRNYETRHALWPGQSNDGRKRQAALGKALFRGRAAPTIVAATATP